MTREFEDRLCDYFTPAELIDFLEGVTTMDVIGAFEDEIEDHAEDLEEFMNHGS